MTTSSETWKDIPGYEGRYQASSEGRIRSLPRIVKRTYSRTGTVFTVRCPGGIKKLKINAAGYPVVNLGNNDVHTVHELVALTFIGQRPQGAEICHGNGVRQDNRVSNLRYASHAENERDKMRYGGRRRKFSAEDVRQIRRRHSAGESNKAIARSYGVSANCIWQTVAGRSYGWID